MTRKTLDDIFNEVEAERADEARKPESPAEIARREVNRKAETEREIRQGLRNPDGSWIEQPETDDDETDDETEDDDQ